MHVCERARVCMSVYVLAGYVDLSDCLTGDMLDGVCVQCVSLTNGTALNYYRFKLVSLSWCRVTGLTI